MEVNKGNYKHYFYLILIILACIAIFHTVKIPITPSIDKSLLIRDFGAKEIGVHDYVLFELEHELLGSGKQNVIKMVGCISGQTLKIDNGTYFCDGVSIKEVRLHREDGSPLPQFTFNGVIPENKAFVYGVGKHSFGSRHWGFIDTTLSSRLIPIL